MVFISLEAGKACFFKVNRKLNVWYDHGSGNGGTLVDFALLYFNCGVKETLQKISFFHPQSSLQNTVIEEPTSQNKSVRANKGKPNDSRIQIMGVKQDLTSLILRFYVKKRKIAQHIANMYCSKVTFGLNNKIFKAIGFKNSAGGYELRNEHFKGSSSPKDITYFDNNANSIYVFEGFFDFLSYQLSNKNKSHL